MKSSIAVCKIIAQPEIKQKSEVQNANLIALSRYMYSGKYHLFRILLSM